MSRTKPNSKTSSSAPGAPITAHPTALISGGAFMAGSHPIHIHEKAVVQLRCRLVSTHGPVTVGEGAIVWDRASVGLLREGGEGVTLGKGAMVESGAKVEGDVGEGSLVEVGAVVGRGAKVGKYCKIAPLCSVGNNEVLPDYTIVYGENQRRVGSADVETLRAKTVERHYQTFKKLGIR